MNELQLNNRYNYYESKWICLNPHNCSKPSQVKWEIEAHKTKNVPKHWGSGYLHFPSLWHTVEVLPTKVIPSWQRKIIEAPRPVPLSMFSSHPFQRRPGWPQLISTHAQIRVMKMKQSIVMSIRWIILSFQKRDSFLWTVLWVFLIVFKLATCSPITLRCDRKSGGNLQLYFEE